MSADPMLQPLLSPEERDALAACAPAETLRSDMGEACPPLTMQSQVPVRLWEMRLVQIQAVLSAQYGFVFWQRTERGEKALTA